MEEEANSLINLKGKDFECTDPITPDLQFSKLSAYFKDLGMNEEIENAKLLSSREKQCLELFLEGMSAKETANLLNLSRRTVEYYFENIKNKLNFWSKNDIFQIASSLKDLGLL